MKYISPTVNETAFNCPHCSVLAKQSWFAVLLSSLSKDDTPWIINEQNLDEFKNNREMKAEVYELFERLSKGRPFKSNDADSYGTLVYNMWFSCCYNCNDISI